MDHTRLHEAVTQITGIVEANPRAVSGPAGSLHRWILNEFARTGAPPSPEIVAEWAAELGIDVSDTVARLVARCCETKSGPTTSDALPDGNHEVPSDQAPVEADVDRKG